MHCLTLVTHTGEEYSRTAFVEKLSTVCSCNLRAVLRIQNLSVSLTQDSWFAVPCICAPPFVIQLCQDMVCIYPKILQNHSALNNGNWWYRVGQLAALLFRVPAWCFTQNFIWGLKEGRWSFLSFLDRTVCFSHATEHPHKRDYLELCIECSVCVFMDK